MVSSPKTVLLEKLSRNDPYTTWLTLSHNHIGMDICALVAALSSNDQVIKVSCHAPFVATLSTFNLARLCSACANLPHLEELWIALPAKRAHLSAPVSNAVLVVGGGILNKLTLRGVDADGCLAVARALNNTKSLKELNLYGACSAEACKELMVSLSGNTSLQHLILPACDFSNACGEALAEVLKENTTLTRLDLTGSPSSRTTTTTQNKKGCQEILNVLASRENETLSWLNLDTTPELQASLSFYTHLNRSGFTSLLKRPEVSWADCMSVLSQKGNDDLSIIYHILSELPHLVTSDHTDGTTLPATTHTLRRTSLRNTLQTAKVKTTIEKPETLHGQRRASLRSIPLAARASSPTNQPTIPLHAGRRASLRSTPLGAALRSPSTTSAGCTSGPPVSSNQTDSPKPAEELCLAESASVMPQSLLGSAALLCPSPIYAPKASAPRSASPKSTVQLCLTQSAFIKPTAASVPKKKSSPPSSLRTTKAPLPSYSRSNTAPTAIRLKPVPAKPVIQNRRASDSSIVITMRNAFERSTMGENADEPESRNSDLQSPAPVPLKKDKVVSPKQVARHSPYAPTCKEKEKHIPVCAKTVPKSATPLDFCQRQMRRSGAKKSSARVVIGGICKHATAAAAICTKPAKKMASTSRSSRKSCAIPLDRSGASYKSVRRSLLRLSLRRQGSWHA